MTMCLTPQLGHSRMSLLTRRAILSGLAGAGGAAVAAAQVPLRVSSERLHLRGTPQLNIGPFYPLNRPPEEDADLTQIAGRPGRARGQIIDLIGRVVDESGRPVSGAQIDMWQTNAAGRYHHPMDTGDAPFDPHFQGAAILRADADGAYRIRTVLPGIYVPKARHIHFDVRGNRRRLITQMFFPGEPNDADGAYASLPSSKLKAAVTARQSTQPSSDGVQTYLWDIILAGE